MGGRLPATPSHGNWQVLLLTTSRWALVPRHRWGSEVVPVASGEFWEGPLPAYQCIRDIRVTAGMPAGVYKVLAVNQAR